MSMRQPRHVMTMSSEGGRFRRSRRIPVPLSLSWAWCVVCGDYASREDNHGRPVLPPFFFVSPSLERHQHLFSKLAQRAPTSIENTPQHTHDYRSACDQKKIGPEARSSQRGSFLMGQMGNGQWAVPPSQIFNSYTKHNALVTSG